MRPTTSDWSAGAFQTIAPQIVVTVPNGGEAWQRGLKYFIQWHDNVAEDVVIDLYKGGTFLKTITTNASTGAYQWQPGLELAPGSDYSVRISSATNGALGDSSDLPFSVDVTRVTGLQPEPGGHWVVQWSGTSAGVYVETNATLAPGQWQTAAGPISGSSWTNPAPGGPGGFFRLRLP